ncbi:MAG TPA: hypothetical protein VF457_15765 [Burkholderiaceae bacterium]
MADAILTLEQRRAIHGADEWLGQAGLPTYTALLGLLELNTRPAATLPAGGHIQLAPPARPTPSVEEVLAAAAPREIVALLRLPADDTEGGCHG